MSLLKKDHLHILIKSLSKSEKKFFTESIKKHNSNNLYLLLFNNLEKQAKSDHNKNKKLFDNKANQLPVIKNYLLKLILKSLQNFHPTELPITQILLQKDLTELALNQINLKIKKLNKLEEFPPLLQALEEKKQIILQQYGPSNPAAQKDLNNLIEEQNQLIEKIHNLNEYQLLQANFYNHFQQSTGLNKTIYTNLHNHPLLTKEHSAKSLPAQIIRAQILYNLHIFKDQNFFEAEQIIKHVLKLVENNPAYQEHHPEVKLDLLNRLIELYVHQKRHTELQHTLKLIRSNTPQNHQQKVQSQRAHLQSFQLELNILEEQLNTQPEEKTTLKKSLNNLEAAIDQQIAQISGQSLQEWEFQLYYQLAKANFIIQNHNQSLQNLQKILPLTEADQRVENLVKKAYLLQITCLIHQKNFRQLKLTLSKFQQFLKTLKHHSSHLKQTVKLVSEYNTMIIKGKTLWSLGKKIAQLRAKVIEKNQENDLTEFFDWLKDEFLLESQSH